MIVKQKHKPRRGNLADLLLYSDIFKTTHGESIVATDQTKLF